MGAVDAAAVVVDVVGVDELTAGVGCGPADIARPRFIPAACRRAHAGVNVVVVAVVVVSDGATRRVPSHGLALEEEEGVTEAEALDERSRFERVRRSIMMVMVV